MRSLSRASGLPLVSPWSKQNMNSVTFISPTLPLSRVCYHPNLVSNRRVPQRVIPTAASNLSHKSLQNVSTYLLYTVTPLLLTNPLSTLAQTTQSTDGAEQIDPTQITEADLDGSLTSRILGWTAFLLLVVTSVGAVVLSIDNFIKTREDKKNRQWVQDRIDRKPYPKNFWSPDEDTTFTKDGRGSGTTGKPMNRETRRMEKRARDKEQREKKRRDKLAEQRAAAKTDKKQTDK